MKEKKGGDALAAAASGAGDGDGEGPDVEAGFANEKVGAAEKSGAGDGAVLADGAKLKAAILAGGWVGAGLGSLDAGALLDRAEPSPAADLDSLAAVCAEADRSRDAALSSCGWSEAGLSLARLLLLRSSRSSRSLCRSASLSLSFSLRSAFACGCFCVCPSCDGSFASAAAVARVLRALPGTGGGFGRA